MKVVVFQVISGGYYPVIPRCSNMCKIPFRELLAESCSHCFAFCLSFIQHVLDTSCMPSILPGPGDRVKREMKSHCMFDVGGPQGPVERVRLNPSLAYAGCVTSGNFPKFFES